MIGSTCLSGLSSVPTRSWLSLSRPSTVTEVPLKPSIVLQSELDVGDQVRELIDTFAGVRGIALAAGIILVYFLLVEPLLDAVEPDSQADEQNIAGTGSSGSPDGTPARNRRPSSQPQSRSQSSGRAQSRTRSTGSPPLGATESDQPSKGTSGGESRANKPQSLGSTEIYELKLSDGSRLGVRVSPVLDAPVDPPSHEDGTIQQTLSKLVERAERNGVRLAPEDLREYKQELAEEYGIWINEVARAEDS